MSTLSPSESADLRIAVVASNWHEQIMQKLVQGARDAFQESCGGGGQLTVITCPGTWEIPLTVLSTWEALDPAPDAFVALGCVIKGETSHDRWINESVCTALTNLSIRMRTPVALGVLTCDTMDQAIARADGERGNKGGEAMRAAVEHATLLRSLSWDQVP